MEARIDRAFPQDDEARLALHEHAFGFRPPSATFRWKYRENPHGEAIELVVREGDRLLAAFALVPRLVRLEGVTVLAHQAADAMTHASVRERGWFTRLLAEGRALAEEQGSAFAFAFSGRRSRTAFERAGYAEVGAYSVVERRLRGRPFWRRSIAFRETEVRQWGTADETRVNGPLLDDAWMRWRFAGIDPPLHSLVHVDLEHAVVLERCEDRAVVARILERGHGTLDLRRVLRSLHRAGVGHLKRTAFRGEAEEAKWGEHGLGFRASLALPFCVQPISRTLDELRPLVAPDAMSWCDLDRDAQGLLLRLAMERGSR